MSFTQPLKNRDESSPLDSRRLIFTCSHMGQSNKQSNITLRAGYVDTVVESGVFGSERQRDIARGAIAVLGDYEFGGFRFAAAVDPGSCLLLGAIDEHNDVGVLIDGAPFMKVKKRGTLALQSLHS